jgi:2,4-dienoyl-CoA reductase-like NADH-dependent reductase (Old Yellow Enzyme family)
MPDVMPGLASPLVVAGTTMRNRVIMPPMANNKADARGYVTDVLVDHYSRHAAGGPGMVVVEHAYVTLTGRVDIQQLGIWSDDHAAGLARIAAAIHAGGAAAVIQITHGGARCPREAIGATAVSPSGVAVPGDKETPRPMELDEIEAVPELFASAASRARAAGFDGVEVHGAHGYLLNQFMSPYTNHRDDAYGGSLEHRLRLIRETLEAVRRELSHGLLMYRLGADDAPVPGTTPADAVEIGVYLEDWGVDLIDCSGGLCGSRPADRTEPGYFVEAGAAVKKAVSIPVAAVGGITDPVYADGLIRRGELDAVCVGRAQLKDPEWAHKALDALQDRA